MAKKLDLTTYPDPLLDRKSKTIDKQYLKTAEFKQLILDMEKTMHESDGVGLAAVQVGVPIRLAVVNIKDGILPLINPTITYRSIKKEGSQEGCLSVPGVYGQVKRSVKIRLKTMDADGKIIKLKAEGFLARVIQHEVDHTNGVLFIKRTKKIDEGKDKLAEMKKDARAKSN
ncbi:MAG: peptide deformylase [Candidatus Buchananbacteria bacterium]|nr:peptide deformylase [Candidatus Buchananbacteria bacterium]